MKSSSADILICGAGYAGIATAYELAVRRGLKNIILVDEREPLTLTSNRGTECYRNWWPGPGDTMVHFMNRSIDLLEQLAQETDNLIGLNRRGYAFFTADPARAAGWQTAAQEISHLGAGPLRHHSTGSTYTPAPPETYQHQPTGADLLLDPTAIHQHYPFLNPDTKAMLHARRCGWFDGKKYSYHLLEQALAAGVRLVRGRVEGITQQNGRVEAVQLSRGSDPDQIQTHHFVIAAGPFLKQVGALLGLDLPVYNELHGKLAFEDTLSLLPRDLPLMIWDDPITLPWTEAERRELAADPHRRHFLEPMAAGVHFRPVGGPDSRLLWILWTYDTQAMEPVWPLLFDPNYTEVALRGMAAMIPAFSAYFGQSGRAIVDGGYYCKTHENRPLVGPLPIKGAYVIAALSGYGLMASQAAADLLADHLTGRPLPTYAPDFLLSRYDDPAYQARLAAWDATSGQL